MRIHKVVVAITSRCLRATRLDGLPLLSGLLLIVLSARSAGAQGYKVTQINPPGATYGSQAEGLNSTATRVVGYYWTTDSNNATAFEWFGGNNYKSFSFPQQGAYNTRAFNINDSGTIVGQFQSSNGLYNGFIYSGGKFTQYDVPGGLGVFNTSLFGVNNSDNYSGSAGCTGYGGPCYGFVLINGVLTTFYGSGTDWTQPYSINNLNETVGQYVDANYNSHGFYRDASGNITTIDFPGATSSGLYGINDSGEMTGWYVNPEGNSQGYTYLNGQFTITDFWSMTAINNNGAYVAFGYGIDNQLAGILAVPQAFKLATVEIPGATSTSTFDINDSNVEVGTYTNSQGVANGMMLAAGKVTNINDPNAMTGTTLCYGINSSGEIVGYYTNSSNATQAFSYSGGANGTFTDITFPGQTSDEAFGVNDSGEIAGGFTDSEGVTHGFVYDPATQAYTQLDVPGASSTIRAWGINNAGTITLSWWDIDGFEQASTYNGSTYTTMNPPWAPYSEIHQINQAGSIVYLWEDYSYNYHAAWYTGGAWYTFDDGTTSSTTAGALDTRADGINNSNVIVGRYIPVGNTEFEGLKAIRQ